MKDAIAMLAAMSIGSIACAVETWLEKRHLDALSGLFLACFTASLLALAVVLIIHFGRFVTA
jgi:hypothetical protein